MEHEYLEIWGRKGQCTKVCPSEIDAPPVVRDCGDSSKINGVVVMQNFCDIGIKHFVFHEVINQSSDLFPGKFYFF